MRARASHIAFALLLTIIRLAIIWAGASGADGIGVNNRDLRTFSTDLNHTLELLPGIPDDRVAVTESGIHTRSDVERMLEGGVDAFLIGEALMIAEDPAAHLRMLRGEPVAEAASCR